MFYNVPGYPKAATGRLIRKAPFCGAKACSCEAACDSDVSPTSSRGARGRQRGRHRGFVGVFYGLFKVTVFLLPKLAVLG